MNPSMNYSHFGKAADHLKKESGTKGFTQTLNISEKQSRVSFRLGIDLKGFRKEYFSLNLSTELTRS
jgi:hypothetical protein